MTETPTFKQALLAALPSLRAFALSLTGRPDRADDLVQETVMKAWAKQGGFTLGTNMQAWLVTILRNTFYSQMRKRGREVQDSDGAFTERLSVPPAHDGVMDMADFRVALAALPDDQREALLLVGASGFSYEEAAGICGCAVGTVKSSCQPSTDASAGNPRHPGRWRLWTRRTQFSQHAADGCFLKRKTPVGTLPDRFRGAPVSLGAGRPRAPARSIRPGDGAVMPEPASRLLSNLRNFKYEKAE